MAIIRTLTVVFSGDTKGLSKSTKFAATTIRNLSKGLASATLNIIKYSAAAAGGAVVGIAALVKGQASAIDRVGKLSDELGISTEALSSYGLAARITGTSVESVEKGLQILTRRIGEAQQGFGEGLKGFKLLNLESDKLAAMPLEDAVKEVAKAISKLPTQSKRAAAAFALLGRRGVDLINFFQLGADGLTEMEVLAARLGLTLTRETAFAVEEANDAIEELGSVLVGVTRSLTVALAPVIGHFADTVTGALLGLSGGFDGLNGPVRAITLFIADATDNVNALVGSIGVGIAGIAKLINIVNKFGPLGLFGDIVPEDGIKSLEKMSRELQKHGVTKKTRLAAEGFLLEADRKSKASFAAKEAALAEKKAEEKRALGTQFLRDALDAKDVVFPPLDMGGTRDQINLEKQLERISANGKKQVEILAEIAGRNATANNAFLLGR